MSLTALPAHTRQTVRLAALTPIGSIAFLSACSDGVESGVGPGDGDGSGEITTLQSAKTRVTPGIIAADLQPLAHGNTEFAFDMYRALRAERGRQPVFLALQHLPGPCDDLGRGPR